MHDDTHDQPATGDPARLTRLINRSPVVAIEWHNAPGWPVSFVSESIAQWGYTCDDLLSGRCTYADLIHPDDRPRIEAEVAAHFAAGPDEYRQEYRLRTAGGFWIWLDDRTWLTRDAAGEVRQIHGVLLDITALKSAESRVMRLNTTLENRVARRTAQLEAANKELEAFCYTVSHDLKAPLRGIEGYSALLEELHGDALPEEGRLFLANIRHGVGQMHELIEDLLAYSRIERQRLETRLFSLPDLVDSVVEGFSHDIAQRGAQIRIGALPAQLNTDPNPLLVILRNLVGNALKFAAAAQPPVIHIEGQLRAGRAMLTVRDNGIGFDMKYHDRIFEIFQRLHRAEEYPGTGIGLAIVRKAVQRLGGKVWAESTPREGASFHLEFPQ